MEKFAPKILEKNSWQIWKLAVGSRFCQNNPAGRPVRSTAQRSIFAHWQLPVDRPGRPKQTESYALIPVNRDGRPSLSAKCAQICARRSTDPVDRLHVKSTCSESKSTDWSLEQKTGSENQFKNILKNLLTLLKITKNSFIILHWYINMW